MQESYKKYVKEYETQQKVCKRKLDIISNFRLLVVLVTIFAIFYLHFYVSDVASWAFLILGVIVFLVFVKVHGKLNHKHKYLTALKEINESNIKRLEGNWLDFKEDGTEYLDKEHKYTWDLDIFGKGSLFQYINTCATKSGKEKLKQALSDATFDIERICLIQEAVKESADKVKWRQEINALATLLNPKNTVNDEHFIHRTTYYTSSLLKVFITILSVTTILSLFLAYGFDVINENIALGLVVFQSIITLVGIKGRGRVLNQLAVINENLSTYADILKVIENEKFSSTLFVSIQKELTFNKNFKASTAIRQLGRISDQASNRKNLFFFPINILLLWDYRCVIKFEKWKANSGNILEKVVDILGETEYINSLGQLYKDKAKWCFPKITQNKCHYIAKDIAHPLIVPRGISNDALMNEASSMLLITGSNMSGKSTYLRTVGINMVLAYAGAPVCASSLELSIYDLHTCMRISDNLEKGISSFYGELLRIKDILSSISKEKKVKFVLLDEIFKGTNSYDRHIGAKALVKQLIDTGSYGLVSTHDLELEVLERETSGKIKNYHFKEYYVNDEIKFDYKLREGVSKTRNAQYLLKLVGIELS